MLIFRSYACRFTFGGFGAKYKRAFVSFFENKENDLWSYGVVTWQSKSELFSAFAALKFGYSLGLYYLCRPNGDARSYNSEQRGNQVRILSSARYCHLRYGKSRKKPLRNREGGLSGESQETCQSEGKVQVCLGYAKHRQSSAIG